MPTQQLDPQLQAFHTYVSRVYQETANTPKLEKWKIGLSIATLGLYALINVIVAFVQTHSIKKSFEELTAIELQFNTSQVPRLQFLRQDEQARVTAEYQERRTPLVKRLFAQMEGIPIRA